MPRSSPEDGFQPRPSAEFAEPALSSPLEAEALDAVVRATVEFADADQKVTPEEIDALKEVARRLGAVPLAFEPVAVQLVEAIIQVNYGHLGREPEVWRAASLKIARLLFDSPMAQGAARRPLAATRRVYVMTPPSTREQLIEQGQGLVHSLAAGIARSLPVRADLEDLVAYGELGLAQAARDFDEAQGVEFTTFAYYRVRGAIYDGLAQMTWTSRAQYRRLRRLQMAEEVIAEDAELAPVGSQQSLEAGVRWLRSVTDRLAAVYLISQNDDGRNIRESGFEDPGATAPTIIAQQEISVRLHKLIDELPNVEKRLIKAVYLEGETLQKAAKLLGISKSWASRLHAKALGMLARALRSLGEGP